MYLPIYLSIYVSIHLHIFLPIFLFISRFHTTHTYFLSTPHPLYLSLSIPLVLSLSFSYFLYPMKEVLLMLRKSRMLLVSGELQVRGTGGTGGGKRAFEDFLNIRYKKRFLLLKNSSLKISQFRYKKGVSCAYRTVPYRTVPYGTMVPYL